MRESWGVSSAMRTVSSDELPHCDSGSGGAQCQPESLEMVACASLVLSSLRMPASRVPWRRRREGWRGAPALSSLGEKRQGVHRRPDAPQQEVGDSSNRGVHGMLEVHRRRCVGTSELRYGSQATSEVREKTEMEAGRKEQIPRDLLLPNPCSGGV